MFSGQLYYLFLPWEAPPYTPPLPIPTLATFKVKLFPLVAYARMVFVERLGLMTFVLLRVGLRSNLD
jgi:hypothetical protein